MILLVLILNKEEHLEEILELFVELGVSGATIIDSVGMGRILSHDIPIFAGFRSLMRGSRPYNKTIFSIVPEELVPDKECCGCSSTLIKSTICLFVEKTFCVIKIYCLFRVIKIY